MQEKNEIPLISTNSSENQVSITDLSRLSPVIKEYPVTSKRCFNSGCYKQFQWLECSVSQDDVFCFICWRFSANIVWPGETNGNVTFVDMGFKKWKDMTFLERLSLLEISEIDKGLYLYFFNITKFLSRTHLL